MSDEIRRGRRFLHARYITEDRQPQECIITHLRSYGETKTVHYDFAGGGAPTMCALEYFLEHSLGKWLD